MPQTPTSTQTRDANAGTENLLIEELSQRIQSALTIDSGFQEIARACVTLNVTIERITLVRGQQTSELIVNENSSGIRREIQSQIAELTITLTCVSAMTPNTNATLQTLVTMAAIAAQQWTTAPLNSETLTPPALHSRMIGSSPQMRELTTEIARAARSNHNVHIKGESGTGKTTAAIMIHEQSLRADKPFIDLNCAALPEALLESELFGYEKGAFTGAAGTKKGLFESADGGTLFLDEIAEMKVELQAKLLTAIEQKKIRRLGSTKDINCNVRIITASSRNLQSMIKAGTFREDLYYRIAVLEIQVASLRERPADIPALILNRLAHEQELSGSPTTFEIEPAALDALAFYDWPGNIRQLQNIISRLTARLEHNRRITIEDVTTQIPVDEILEGSIVLPASIRILRPNETLYDYISRVQLLAIEETVTTEGNNTRASERLGYGRSGLHDLKYKLIRKANSKNKEKPVSPIHLATTNNQNCQDRSAVA